MDINDKKSIYIDINSAVEICRQCKNFKKLPPKRTNFPIFFCTKSDEKIKHQNEKYLPCIAENISHKCMANFIIKNLKISELILHSFS